MHIVKLQYLKLFFPTREPNVLQKWTDLISKYNPSFVITYGLKNFKEYKIQNWPTSVHKAIRIFELVT